MNYVSTARIRDHRRSTDDKFRTHESMIWMDDVSTSLIITATALKLNFSFYDASNVNHYSFTLVQTNNITNILNLTDSNNNSDHHNNKTTVMNVIYRNPSKLQLELYFGVLFALLIIVGALVFVSLRTDAFPFRNEQNVSTLGVKSVKSRNTKSLKRDTDRDIEEVSFARSDRCNDSDESSSEFARPSALLIPPNNDYMISGPQNSPVDRTLRAQNIFNSVVSNVRRDHRKYQSAAF